MSLIRWQTKKVKVDSEAPAKRLAAEGATEGTVLVSHPDGRSGLSLSVVLRPTDNGNWGLFPLIISFCTSEGIRKDTGIITWLRWPDKVLVERKVVAKTSVARGSGAGSEWAVLTSRIRTKAEAGLGSDECSLFDSLGVDLDPEFLADKILESISWMYSGWTRQMDDHILARCRSMLDTIGRRIEISQEGSLRVGTVKDIDDIGNLVVDFGGSMESITADDAARLREL
ncbi:MAG: hypothetical protein OK456_09105 [Thaumarchaeota archaeon]|nr:hypothetical protein [Nitrososphaerota archaeon]